ncbi:hypothetical protein ROLI_004690 [Roseobacter fucihabitans]|uniref:glutathione transferase n=1 Tax=Roseobacter fucihabitans TaxID=1537242 RepID=A0ABZ2BN01_9RHOB|nr:glutathione S-transferase family protein [Roseobacter litoralis]MBC6964643.1 Stringent starvation protein A [Roseobacter litoralis]
MTAGLTVHGYEHSVYTRAVLVALAEKRVAFQFDPIDPFETDPADACRALHPFGRVPVLSHEGFVIYETAAILRYVDLAFPHPALIPQNPKAAARMAQVISITDSYGYWPLVRQVFAHRVFRPWEGLAPDEDQIAQGMSQAPRVLRALEDIAVQGHVLAGPEPTLADCHLAPMIAAFSAAPEGAQMLAEYPALSAWWSHWAGRVSMRQTDTGFDREIG